MNSTAQASTPLTDITNSTIIEYHPISDRIRDTAIHPTENSLFVLTLDNLFILEENKTIELNLTGYGDYTTHHVQSDLIVIEENAEVYYYAFFKIKIDGRFGEDFDMKVRKIHEIVYANKYESREELNVPL